MRAARALIAAGALSLWPLAASADEDLVRSQIDMAQTALRDGRYGAAEASAAAALRTAEDELGASPLTAQAAFQLAVVQIARAEHASAKETAARISELVDGGHATGPATPEAAELLDRLAAFAPGPLRRTRIRGLEGALDSYAQSSRFDPYLLALGWARIADALNDYSSRPEAFEAARRSSDVMDAHRAAMPADLQALVAEIGGDTAIWTWDEAEDRIDVGLLLVHRGLAAQPPSPREQPIPPEIGRLLRLRMILEAWGASALDPDLTEPRWESARYGATEACPLEWIDRSPPRYPARGRYHWAEPMLLFEYHLDTDGSVARVEGVGLYPDEYGFTEAVIDAMAQWRAEPPARAECSGPRLFRFIFQMSP